MWYVQFNLVGFCHPEPTLNWQLLNPGELYLSYYDYLTLLAWIMEYN